LYQLERERERERERGSAYSNLQYGSLLNQLQRERERDTHILNAYVNYPCIQSLPFPLCVRKTEKERERERMGNDN
jgi:hypothetical protein